MVNSAANLVPDSVPRGVAKGGVAVAGALVAFWVLQKVGVGSLVATTVICGQGLPLAFHACIKVTSSRQLVRTSHNWPGHRAQAAAHSYYPQACRALFP